MASCSIDAGPSEHSVPSSSSGSREVPAIFLSHSGRQKAFVEHLHEALVKVNHYAFFDQQSLPKGSRFPEHVKNAAFGCTLGVVVLSEDFLTSKWPMLELEILVQQRQQREAEAKVLPLFYKLAPKDLNRSEKLVEWRKKWEEMATPEDVIKWAKALRALRAFNGEVFQQGTSEGEYIKRVVEIICREVPSPLPYDVSEIVGHHRLAKEIAGQFECLCDARQGGGACMIGLHRQGGGGKSTTCRAMVNLYSSKYPGRSHHFELPTNGTDESIIVQKCKEALEVLADLDDKLLRKAHDIDQVIGLMKAHLARHDVFLAIDNVRESTLEVAGRILGVGFSSKSKIMVTSRSEEVLTELLRDQDNWRVDPLPALEDEEALQIFLKSCKLGDLHSLVRERCLVDRVRRRCKFDGTYHAVALKALGVQVKNACTPGGAWQQHLDIDVICSALDSIKQAELTGVDDVIRLTYDNLGERNKSVFLDIVLLPSIGGGNDLGRRRTYERACQLLSSLYKELSPEAMIRELSLGGLLQLENDGCTGERMIRVHDLFCDLAEREAASSSRFFIAGKSSRAVEGIEWQALERVIMPQPPWPQFIKHLQQRKYRRLQVLDASGVRFLEGIDMRRMPSLCVLKLDGGSLRSIHNWSAAAGLAFIDLRKVRCEQSMRVLSLQGMARLQNLRLTGLEIVERIEGLDTLTALQSLQVMRCKFLKRIPDDLSSLTRLRNVQISNCPALKRIPDLSSLACLDTLHLKSIESMEVGAFSSSLRHVHIGWCFSLKELPDMSGLTRLETLSISLCKALKRVPDLSCATRLDELCLLENDSMEEVVGLSPALRNVELRECQALKWMPDVSGLTRLEVLSVARCHALKRIPDLSGLSRLEWLVLRRNRSMEEVGGLSPALRHVEISHCNALREAPGISGLTRLETLSFCHNEALEDVVVSQQNSGEGGELVCQRCRSMKEIRRREKSGKRMGRSTAETMVLACVQCFPD